MLHKKIFLKVSLFLYLALLPVWCSASFGGLYHSMGYSDIQVKEKKVQNEPKGSSIQATIDGHFLSIVFLENLGQVEIKVTSVTGGEVQTQTTPTPFGVDFYIYNTGDFVVTFTLSNGDEYYGEFSITD